MTPETRATLAWFALIGLGAIAAACGWLGLAIGLLGAAP